MNTQSLPDELLSICDAAVDHAHGAGPLPKELPKLLEWVTTNCRDELMDCWIDDKMALAAEAQAQGCFNDVELRCYEGLDDSDEISDETRVAYAKQLAEDWRDDGYIFPSVHGVPIVGSSGKAAVLGYLVEIHGQGGAEPVYAGLYPNNESFCESLRQSGYWLSDEIDDISDESILKLWEKPKPKPKSKPKPKAKLPQKTKSKSNSKASTAGSR